MQKTVVLGITGSIAAYKMANVVSMLRKRNYNVHVIMTKNAQNFIHPITFETLSGHKCITDTFDRNFSFEVEHISLAKQADVFLVAPASANMIGKLANGIADDMLSTTILAAKCPILVAPAMNSNMYTNPIVQENINKLKEYGMTMIEPDTGRLACGGDGIGKLAREETILSYIERECACEKDLQGKKILVTAGPTQESIDPVRYITNHSSGKMGYAIARQAMLRGAEVILISGPTEFDPIPFVNIVNVVTAQEMYQQVMEKSKNMDIIIKAAAVADYRPKKTEEQKMKKSGQDIHLELERTQDILQKLGENKPDHQILCGFSMETENIIDNSRKKLLTKGADIIAANSLTEPGAGFRCDTNRLILITPHQVVELPCLSKEETANELLNFIYTLTYAIMAK